MGSPKESRKSAGRASSRRVLTWLGFLLLGLVVWVNWDKLLTALLPEEGDFLGGVQSLQAPAGEEQPGGRAVRRVLCTGGSDASNPCRGVEAVVMVKGSLTERLSALCTASAMAKLLKVKLRVVWLNDAFFPSAPFSQFFKPDPFVIEGSGPHGQWPPASFLRREILIPRCKKESAAARLEVFVAPEMVNWLGYDSLDSCELTAVHRNCLGGLTPSKEVEAVLAREDMKRLEKSTAVYIEPPISPAPCSGCATSLETCTMRRLAMAMLRSPQDDFVVAAPSPRSAATTANFFHPLRAPLVLKAAIARNFLCPFAADMSEEERRAASSVFAVRRRRLLSVEAEEKEEKKKKEEEKEEKKKKEKKKEEKRKKEGRGLETREEDEDDDEEAINLNESPGADVRMFITAMNATIGGERQADGGILPIQERSSHENRDKCNLLEFAELVALSRAQAFIPFTPSSVAATFITSQAAAAKRTLAVLESICLADPIRALIHQRISLFTVIEKKLKLVYCAVPKVACTSFLMWIRAALGLPHPEDPLLALDEYKSGWHLLGIHFTEEEAVRQMTHPKYFKFSFVRNPFTRIASAYSNKIVVSDNPDNPTKPGPGSRGYWAHAFFRWIQPTYEVIKDSEGLISFKDFVQLVGKVLQIERWHMDRHIAPQVDLCGLDRIKYDFIGSFENVGEDAKKIVDRFGGENLEFFHLGKGAHFTNADKKLAGMYDKETFERVKKIYSMDFNVQLNNITHEAPLSLREIFDEG